MKPKVRQGRQRTGFPTVCRADPHLCAKSKLIPKARTVERQETAIARDALSASDVILLVLPPQLLTGDREAMLAILSGKLFSHAGMMMAGAVKTVIARLDEGSVDPTDDEEGYQDFLASKRNEWRQLLLREQITQPESDVFTVAADPYQSVGNDPAPLRTSYGDAYRRWDGIAHPAPTWLADLCAGGNRTGWPDHGRGRSS